MCGIVGIVQRTGHIDEGLLTAMRDTMFHRGPDDAGTWISADQRVGFGHRRLAIVDLTPTGHQPMQSQDGKLHIIFNGEIYNFLELRGELSRHGYSFIGTSDTEVILAAYKEWGVGLLERLNGMFAMAIYDAPGERLFIARDRAGEKPLFYYHSRDVFAFSSELKALMALPAFPRRIDPHALNHFFTFGYVPREKCIFANTYKLPQGHALLYDLKNRGLRVWQYWHLPERANANGSTVDVDAYRDELHRLLQDSVKRQIIADVPVGVLLSGGLDSSLVTAVAASVSSRPVKTFTISFPGHGAYDEGPYARLVANHFGTDHNELFAEPATVDLLPRLAEQYDEPLADSSMVPTYLVARMIRQEAKVALGGDGGDELFGGYPHYVWLQRQQRLRAMIPAGVRRIMGTAAERWMPLGMRGRNWIIGFTSELKRSLAHVNVYFDLYSRSRLLAPMWGNGLSEAASQPEVWKSELSLQNGSSALQQATRSDFFTYLCDDILTKVDRASMLTSLEVRAPFLDHRIIDFAFAKLPDSLRATEKGRKILLRELGKKLLPLQFDLTRKQGFTLPLQSWFKGSWGIYVDDILREADPTIFDRTFINDLIAGQRRGYSNTQRLFSIMMFELWRRSYRPTL